MCAHGAKLKLKAQLSVVAIGPFYCCSHLCMAAVRGACLCVTWLTRGHLCMWSSCQIPPVTALVTPPLPHAHAPLRWNFWFCPFSLDPLVSAHRPLLSHTHGSHALHALAIVATWRRPPRRRVLQVHITAESKRRDCEAAGEASLVLVQLCVCVWTHAGWWLYCWALPN